MKSDKDLRGRVLPHFQTIQVPVIRVSLTSSPRISLIHLLMSQFPGPHWPTDGSTVISNWPDGSTPDGSRGLAASAGDSASAGFGRRTRDPSPWPGRRFHQHERHRWAQHLWPLCLEGGKRECEGGVPGGGRWRDNGLVSC